MKSIRCYFTLLILGSTFAFWGNLSAQTAPEVKPERQEKLFGTLVEIGYVWENSEELSGGLMFKTAFEYRLKRSNHFFFRIDYDDYDVDFNVADLPGLVNQANGVTSINDLIIGGGYRIGNERIRVNTLVQAGAKSYDLPVVTQENNLVTILKEDKRVLTSRATLGFEYYVRRTVAFSFDGFYNRVWEAKDFWRDIQGAWGITFGLIGTFI